MSTQSLVWLHTVYYTHKKTTKTFTIVRLKSNVENVVSVLKCLDHLEILVSVTEIKNLFLSSDVLQFITRFFRFILVLHWLHASHFWQFLSREIVFDLSIKQIPGRTLNLMNWVSLHWLLQNQLQPLR